MNVRIALLASACMIALSAWAQKPPTRDDDTDKWVTATGQTATTGPNAKDEAEKLALRKAVEEACGVFIKAQSKTKDYQAVYDKVLANTVGYVIEFKTIKTWTEGSDTFATVKARVSTKKFSENWAHIAHTLQQENNPRVVVCIAEPTAWTATGPADTQEAGVAQAKIEDFLLDKGLSLMDRDTAEKTNKRDLLLATAKGDEKEIAAVAARFKADVVISGKATAQRSRKVRVGDADMYQYTVSLSVRAIQTDSARILASKDFTKTYTELQTGAEKKVLSKLASDNAGDLLEAVVAAWAKRANVSKTIELNITGMDYDAWKLLKAESEKIRGLQAIRLRELVESVAQIDVEYELTIENLADRLTALKDVKLKVTEMSANRIKLKLVKDKE